MAYGTKYQIQYKDTAGNLNKIHLKVADYLGAITELTRTANPLEISFPEIKKLDSVAPSGCTLNFYTGGHNLSELFNTDPFETQVLHLDASNNIKGEYYINPENFRQQAWRNNAPIQVTCNNGLAALKRVNYFTNTADANQMGRATIMQVLENCLSDLNFENYYLLNDLKEENLSHRDSLLLTATTDLSNYINEDGDSDTKRTVIEKIMTRYGLTLAIAAHNCFIFNHSHLKAASFPYVKKIPRTLTGITTITLNNKLAVSGLTKWYHADLEQETAPGYNKVALNIKTYPDSKKVVPFENLKLHDFGAVAWANYDSTNNGNYVAVAQPNLTDNYITLANDGRFIEIRNNQNAVNGSKYLGIINVHETADTTAQITIESGHIQPNADNLTLRLKTRFETGAPSDERSYTSLKFKIAIKIGSKFATGGTNNTVAMTSDTIQYCTIESYNKGENLRGQETTTDIHITDITNAGQCFIYISKYILMKNAAGNTVAPSAISPTYLLFNDFEPLINDAEIDDEGIEEIGRTKTLFSQSKTIPVDLCEYRKGGLLDRAAIFAGSNTTKNWYLDSEALNYQSIDDILLRFHCSEYLSTSQVLRGTIKTPYLYEKIDETFSNTLLPFTVLTDTNFGSTEFANMGGVFNTRTREYKGTFTEIKGVTEDI